MRAGGGKAKGSSFEREICKRLSLWLSHGKRTDLFWRSAMSGGRATIANRLGRGGRIKVRQPGDITAVAIEGAVLTDRYVIECKHVRNLQLTAFLLEGRGAKQSIAGYWKKLRGEAKRHHKLPMLIAKQNNMPVIVVLENGITDSLSDASWRIDSADLYVVCLFDDLCRTPQRYMPWHH